MGAFQITRLILAALMIPPIAACSPGFDDAAAIAGKAAETVGCQSFSDEFFDALYRPLLEGRELPKADAIAARLEVQLHESPRFRDLPFRARERILADAKALYKTLQDDARAGLEPTDRMGHLRRLAGLELGARYDLAARIQEEIQTRKSNLEDVARAYDIECGPRPGPTPEPMPEPTPAASGPSLTWLGQIEKTRDRPVFGAWKTMATAYQSCEAVARAPLTAAVPPVQGIIETGRHPNGAGQKRVIANLGLVVQTHPYLIGFKPLANSCVDGRKSPLIYDYGGKPFASAETDSKINFFIDAGSGTSVLGADCSGFIYSSLASAGLKVKKSGRLKAIGVMGLSSSMVKNPEGNGLTCLARVSPGALKAGDIVASGGHVLMIDTVSADPLGLARATSAGQCTPAKLSHKGFRMTVIQSSPSAGAVGINRMDAADYFSESPTMASGLVSFAVDSCRARFGLPPLNASKSIRVVRHLSEDPSCVDRAVRLEKEECLAHCPLSLVPLVPLASLAP